MQGSYPRWDGFFGSQNFYGYSVSTPAVGGTYGSVLYYTSHDPGGDLVFVRDSYYQTENLVAGVNAGGVIYAICKGNDGLYIAGYFSSVNGVPATNVAKLTGSGWVGLNTTLVPVAVAAGNNGTVYIGTQNTTSTCDHDDVQVFLKWNPNALQWQTVGGGMEILGTSQAGVHCLAIDQTDGVSVFVGGNFLGGSGVYSPNLIKWNGQTHAWVAMGSGLVADPGTILDCNHNEFLSPISQSWVTEIAVAASTEVYVAGRFYGGIARFSSTGNRLSFGTLLKGGGGEEGFGIAYLNGVVYVSGLFDSVSDGVSNTSANGVAQWHANIWSSLSCGLWSPDGLATGGKLAVTANSVIVFQAGPNGYQNAGCESLDQVPARWQIYADSLLPH